MAYFRRQTVALDTHALEQIGRRALRKSASRKAVKATWSGAKLAGRKGYARRRPLAPVYVTLGLLTVGWVLSMVRQGANTATVLTLIGAGGVFWRGRRRGWSTARWRYAGGVTATAGLWLIGAAAFGVGPPMPGFLVLGFLGAGGPWWWHHRIREQEEQALSPVDIWTGLVACPGGAIPGSVLSGFRYVNEGKSA